MTAYYNENDPYAAQWLRNLITAGHIAKGDVDERSIVDVRADDLRGYTQCHFFAGIGGWSLALRLAGWPDDRPVWTGSCPCQPFSAAGKGEAMTNVTFGLRGFLSSPSYTLQQSLESRLKRQLDGAGSTLFSLTWRDKATPAGRPYCQLAASALRTSGSDCGSPHHWTTPQAHDTSPRGKGQKVKHGTRHGCACLATDAQLASWPTAKASDGQGGRTSKTAGGGNSHLDIVARLASGATPTKRGRKDDARQDQDQGGNLGERVTQPASDPRWPWDGAEWLPCTDGKARPVEPGAFPLAHGIPGRVGRLRAYGNAIVPQVAAAFIEAVMVDDRE